MNNFADEKKKLDPDHFFKVNIQELRDHQEELAALLLETKDKKLIKDSFSAVMHGILQLEIELKSIIYKRIHLEVGQENYNKSIQEHKNLFNYLGEAGNGLGIISFNYDLLADSALAATIGGNWTWSPESFYIQNFDPTPRIVRQPDKGNFNRYMLKLHGSVNWFMPKTGPREFVSGDRDENGPHMKDPNDLQNLIPEIVAPVADKFSALEGEGLAGHHGRSWTAALQTLLTAKEWIFIGYSLPPADENAKWLFSAASAYRRKQGSFPRVTVVDYHDSCTREDACCRRFGDHNLIRLLNEYAGSRLDHSRLHCCGLSKYVSQLNS